MSVFRAATLFSCLLLIAAPSAVKAADTSDRSFEQIVSKGVSYLQSNGQASDGSYSPQVGIGITALVTTALLENGRSPQEPSIAKSLTLLASAVQPNQV